MMNSAKRNTIIQGDRLDSGFGLLLRIGSTRFDRVACLPE